MQEQRPVVLGFLQHPQKTDVHHDHPLGDTSRLHFRLEVGSERIEVFWGQGVDQSIPGVTLKNSAQDRYTRRRDKQESEGEERRRPEYVQREADDHAQ